MTIAFKPATSSRELASARLRAYVPSEYLKAAGWDCEMFDAARADQYRAVVFQKAYAEEDIALVTRLRSRGAATIFDLCDNHFYDPESRPEFHERADRLRRMIDAVDAVTVSTPQLAELIGRPASVVDDALDPILPDRLALARKAWRRIHRGALRFIWFGNAGMAYPPFGLVDLARIVPELAAAHSHRPIQLTVISNAKDAVAKIAATAPFPIRYREHEIVSCQHAIRDHDLCIIPVGINPFTICKTLNRPALALRLGVPVIADSIPSYHELGPYIGVADWCRNIDAFATNQAGWKYRADAGGEYLRMKYTPERVVRQWSAVLAPFVTTPKQTQAA